jgi:hypothetical protein
VSATLRIEYAAFAGEELNGYIHVRRTEDSEVIREHEATCDENASDVLVLMYRVSPGSLQKQRLSTTHLLAHDRDLVSTKQLKHK